MDRQFTIEDYKAIDKYLNGIINSDTFNEENIYISNFEPGNNYHLTVLELIKISSSFREQKVYIHGNFRAYLWFLYQKFFCKADFIWLNKKVKPDSLAQLFKECYDNKILNKLGTEVLVRRGIHYEDIYNEYYNPKYLRKKYRKEKKNV